MKIHTIFPTNFFRNHAWVKIYDDEGQELFTHLFPITETTTKEDVIGYQDTALAIYKNKIGNSETEKLVSDEKIAELAANFSEPKNVE